MNEIVFLDKNGNYVSSLNFKYSLNTVQDGHDVSMCFDGNLNTWCSTSDQLTDGAQGVLTIWNVPSNTVTQVVAYNKLGGYGAQLLEGTLIQAFIDYGDHVPNIDFLQWSSNFGSPPHYPARD